MTALSTQTSPGLKGIGLASQLEILGISPDLLRARCRNLYIMRWSGECSVRDLNTIFFEIRALAEKHETVVVVSLLDVGARPPSSEGREVIARHQAQMADRLVLINLVDGQGFWASIMLNALLGIQSMKSKRTERERVFRHREEACAWIKQFVAGGALAHDIGRVIQECRDAAVREQLATAS